MEAKRPTALIVVVVLSIVLGGLGMLGGCMGVFGTAMQSSVMELNERMSQGNPQLEAQLEPQRRLMEAQAPFRIPMIGAQIANVIASILLIVGASLLVALKRSGAMVYLVAAGFCALVDLANGALGVFMSMQAQDAMVGAVTGMPGQDQAVMGAAVQAGGVVGVLFGLVWVAVKIAIYAFGIWTSRSEPVQGALT